MAPVRLEPAALPSRVKHSTTEPLRSLFFFVWLLFCCAVLSVVSSFAIILLGKGELVALLELPFDVM